MTSDQLQKANEMAAEIAELQIALDLVQESNASAKIEISFYEAYRSEKSNILKTSINWVPRLREVIQHRLTETTNRFEEFLNPIQP